MKFIHLTDLHFVPPDRELYGRDPSLALRAAVRDINLNHADAELVVITGDLTHWGEPEAFGHLAAILSDLAPPLQLLIGNHDNRDLFRAAFPDQGIDENGFVQSARDTVAGRFVFLDTVLPGTHAGHYTPDRCDWLARTLQDVADRDLFLFMHHPPFPIGLPAVDNIGLQQRDVFRDIVAPHRHRIRHLFFGHVHRPVAGSWMGIPVSTIRALNHQVWFDMKGGALTGSFEPPAYAVVTVDRDTVMVNFHDFMDASTKFALGDSPWNDWSKRGWHP